MLVMRCVVSGDDAKVYANLGKVYASLEKVYVSLEKVYAEPGE